MQDQDIITHIVEGVRTQQEAELLQGEIGRLEESLYRADAALFEEILKSRVPERIAHIIQEEENGGTFEAKRESLKKLLEAIKKKLGESENIKIDIAFEPSEKTIEKISDWVRKEIGNQVLLDVGHDRSLGAGARIMYKGKYKEYALRQMIDDVLVHSRLRIMKEVNPVRSRL